MSYGVIPRPEPLNPLPGRPCRSDSLAAFWDHLAHRKTRSRRSAGFCDLADFGAAPPALAHGDAADAGLDTRPVMSWASSLAR